MRRGPRPRAAAFEVVCLALLLSLAVYGALAPTAPLPQVSDRTGPFALVRVDASAPPGAGAAPLATVAVYGSVDIEALAATRSGDPFDVVATATFTLTGASHTYEASAFYVGGEDGLYVYRFRFTPSAAGLWRFTTSSAVPGLDGLSGSVTAEPGTLSGPIDAVGASIVATAPDGTLSATTYRGLYVDGGLLDGLGDVPLEPEALRAALSGVLDDVAALGFDALQVALNHEWLALGRPRADQHASLQPDTRTFWLLDNLLALAHERGLAVHFWQWGDEKRLYSPDGIRPDPLVPGDDGGSDGAAFDRLQRYIAARLGPVPNWTMSFGFDLDEWAREDRVRRWESMLRSALPLEHLITATEEGSGSQLFDLGEDKLRLVSRDVDPLEIGEDPYDLATAELARAGGHPLLLETRYAYDAQGPWDMTATRRAMWRFALAGGVGSLWSLSAGDAYEAPDQLVTFARFWAGRLPIGGTARRLDDTTFALSGVAGGVVYAEDANSVPLPDLPPGARAVAVDALAPYRELPVAVDGGSWGAPYASDWAVAYSTATP